MKLSKLFAVIAGLIFISSFVLSTQVSGESDPGTEMSSDVISENDKLFADWVKNNQDFQKPSPDALENQLTQLQYEVTQEEGTERPFKNEYWDNKTDGIYVDVVSGEPLFSSTHKFKSGTGWPSFYRAISEDAMVKKSDLSLFGVRTELRSSVADSHLGHVFEDGPAPTGKRYCINSASLKFIPKEELESAGYGKFLLLFE